MPKTLESRDFINPYYLWLYGLVKPGRFEYVDPSKYSRLCKVLYFTKFTWVLPLDEDRALDGIALRSKYEAEENDIITYVEKEDCTTASVLEVLIALSEQMSYLIVDFASDEQIPIGRFFWELIQNLGLLPYTDDELAYGPYALLSLNGHIRRWLLREFTYDGVGSPFPLRHPQVDQRKETLTYQMNRYILENYC